MPRYNILYNANLNEDISFSVQAASQDDALLVAETIVFDIVSTTNFFNENVELIVDSIEVQQPSYTPVNPGEESPPLQDSTYTSLATLYSRNTAPQAAYQLNSCNDNTSNYSRLT